MEMQIIGGKHVENVHKFFEVFLREIAAQNLPFRKSNLSRPACCEQSARR